MTPPESVPPHGISLPIHWTRVIDGDTIVAVLPSGRRARLRIEGFDAPEAETMEGMKATHALESLLEQTDDQELTAFIPLPEDRDDNGILDLDELLSALSFERVRAYLFTGGIRIDLWMQDHGHFK